MPAKSSFSAPLECSGTAAFDLQADSVRVPAARRRTSPAGGRALEVLGHAIEYLADEYAFTTAQMGTLDSADPRIEAIQMLMSLNRQVYYSCPEAEPAYRRIAGWFFRSAASQPKRTSL